MNSYSYDKILSVAKLCVSNIKKEYKNGINVNWSYYICKAIITPNKNIKQITIGKAPSPTGESINKSITKNQYLSSIKNYINYIERKHRLPNYVTVANLKCHPTLFTAFVSHILVNNKPSHQTLNSKIYSKPKDKYGHSTKNGCDNMGQNTSYYCGCHSLQEIVRNLTGKVIPQSTIASICGTTSSGTDHQGLNTFVAWFNKKYNYNLSVEWKYFSDLNWNGIKKILESTNQDCLIHNLYRNKYGHYEVVNKIESTNVKVQNSLGDKCEKGCYCGYVENRSPNEFKSYINGVSQKSIMVITRK